MLRDLLHYIKAVRGMAPAAIASATTTKGSGVDRSGFAAVTFILSAAYTAGTFTWKIQESDTDVDATYADVAVGDLILPTGYTANSFAPATTVLLPVGYVGRKKYVRAVCVTVGGTVTSTYAMADVILSSARVGPLN